MSRLLFVLDIGFDRGGPSVHLLQDIIRTGLTQGHTIDVILKDTGGPLTVMPEDFIRHHNFNYYVIKEDNEKKYGFVGRYINEVKYAKKCSKVFINNLRYDSVFLQSNTVAFFYIRLLEKIGCRIVFNVQDIFPYNLKYSGQLPLSFISFPIFRKLQNIAYQKADSIITISEDMKQTLIDDGVKAEKIYVVYNWSYDNSPISLETIDLNNFFDLKLDHSKFNIVYAGNIGRMQNVELIAETAINMKYNQNVHFYIIGDGTNKHHIEEKVNGLPNVTMLPMQPSKYAESIYAQADLNIIPLMPGGIKTALPSKTATVLRVNKPVVFCVDASSKFIYSLKDVKKVLFADVCKSNSLMEVIIKMSETKSQIAKCSLDIEPFFTRFSSKNSIKYIEILTRNNNE